MRQIEIVIFEPMIRSLPNALTLCNLFAGCCAIAALFGEKPVAVLILACCCLLFDMLDGLLARRLQVSSALGVQLDSLADLVSFGVLPGCILYDLLSSTCPAASVPAWTAFFAFIVPVAAALRLAKFNLDTRDRKVFHGLPTPSAALLVFGLLWMYADVHSWWLSVCSPVMLLTVIILLSVLMLSNLKLWSLKGIENPHGRTILYSMLGGFVFLLIMTGSAAVTLMVVLYILFGFVNQSVKIY